MREKGEGVKEGEKEGRKGEKEEVIRKKASKNEKFNTNRSEMEGYYLILIIHRTSQETV